MTVTVANTANTSTFDYWKTRTNELAFAMSTQAVTAGGNPATGNAVVNGFITATGLKLANATVNVSINIPNTVIQADGNYFLNANGSFTSVITSYSNTVTTTNTSSQVIDSYAIASYNAAEYLIAARSTTVNNYYASKLLTMHNVGNAYSTEYAVIISNNSVGTFGCDSNATHVRLLFTPVSNTTVKLTRTAL